MKPEDDPRCDAVPSAAIVVLILLVLLFLVAGCGGGSGSPAAQQQYRRDLLVGYYGGCATTVTENGADVNLHWATGWCGAGEAWHLAVTQEIALARGQGVRNLVLALPIGMVWQPNAAAEIAFQFGRLQQAGALDGWDQIAVYPADEPDTAENGPRSDSEVTAMVGMLRGVMRGFPALSGKPVGVIYACSTGRRPGIAAFDWVGCDNYGAGCDVVAIDYPALAKLLRADQRLMIVPGGSDPWRQDPACFEAYAQANQRVVAIISFIWQDAAAPGVGAGIRSNGLRNAYCTVARRVRYGTADGC